MCLNTISKPSFLKRVLGLQPASGRGYKIFVVEEGVLKGAVMGRGPRPEGVWVVDDNPNHLSDCGFHVYKKLADARAGLDHLRANAPYLSQRVYVLRRVRYRNAVTHGRGDGMSLIKASVVVARELYIEPGNTGTGA